MNIIKYLVEEIGVDVNEANDSGEAPIHRSIFRKREDILEYLILHGADMNLNKRPKLAK